MTLDDTPYAFEIDSRDRKNPGSELDNFVWMLFRAKPEESRKYADYLVRNGVNPSVLTLIAARSYFPFANHCTEQPIRAKRIAKLFSNSPFYWNSSFIQSQDIKVEEKK